MRLQNKTAVLTGAADGIGRACAERMAAEGAKVVIGDINVKKGREAVEAIRISGGEAVFKQCDVGVDDDVRALMDHAVAIYGSLNVLHNNAAVAIASMITEMDEKDWDKVMNINLSSVYRGCKYAIPYMQQLGGGSIIHTSSVQAHVGFSGWPAYAAAKGAVMALTKNLAVEYAPDNIRINTISPGTIQTPMNEKILAETENAEALEKEWLSYHPIGRLGQPKEVAAAAVFLASDNSRFITGEDLRVDGGMVVKP